MLKGKVECIDFLSLTKIKVLQVHIFFKSILPEIANPLNPTASTKNEIATPLV